MKTNDIDNSDTLKHKKKKTLCAVKNPSNRSEQPWIYNTFFGALLKNKPKRNHTKVNWLMKLNKDEIKLLREKTCIVIEIEDNIKKQLEKEKTGVETNKT